MPAKPVEIVVTADINKALKQLRLVQRRFKNLKNTVKDISDSSYRMARSTGTHLLALATAAAVPINEFRKVELGIAKVGKTTGLAGKELQKLGKDLINLDLPNRSEEVLEIAHVAGQLGIKGSANITKFTETMAKLGFATTVQGEEGAKSLARFMGLVNENIDQVDRFANVLVKLGNNAKANETEILEQAKVLAQNLIVYKASSDQVAALATTLAELDLNVEAAGSSMFTLGKTMASALKTGSDSGKLFAEVMGVSLSEAVRMFEKDAFSAMKTFLGALGSLKDQEKVMKDSGLNQVRINRTLLSLAGRYSEWEKNTRLVNQELKDQNALNREFNRVMDTFHGSIQLAIKDLQVFAQNLGEALVQQFSGAFDAVGKFAKALRELDENTLKIVASFAEITFKVLGWITVVFGAIGAIGSLVGAYIGAATIIKSRFIASLALKIKTQVASIAMNYRHAFSFKALGKGIMIAVKALGAMIAGMLKALLFTPKGWALIAVVGGLYLAFKKLTDAFPAVKLFFTRLRGWLGMGDTKSLVEENLKNVNKELGRLERAGETASATYKKLLRERKIYQDELARLSTEEKPAGVRELRRVDEGGAAPATGTGLRSVSIKDVASHEKEVQNLIREARLQGWEATEAQAKILDEISIQERKKFYKRIVEDARTAEESRFDIVKKEAERDIAIKNKQLEFENRYGEDLTEVQKIFLDKEIEDIKKSYNDRLGEFERFKQLEREAKELGFEMDAEQKAVFDQLDADNRIMIMENVIRDAETLKDAKADILNKELETKAKIRKAEIEFEARFGKDLNRVQKMALAERIKNIKESANEEGDVDKDAKKKKQLAADTLMAMQRSQFRELRIIGKAAALFQLRVDAIKGVSAVYTETLRIPVVGPVLAPIAAAATAVWYGEQAAKIAGLARGGTVKAKGMPSGDVIPAMMHDGEMAVPKTFREEVMDAVATKRLAMEKAPAPAVAADQTPRVSLTIQGDVLDSQETGVRILEILSNSESFNNIDVGSFSGA